MSSRRRLNQCPVLFSHHKLNHMVPIMRLIMWYICTSITLYQQKHDKNCTGIYFSAWRLWQYSMITTNLIWMIWRWVMRKTLYRGEWTAQIWGILMLLRERHSSTHNIFSLTQIKEVCLVLCVGRLYLISIVLYYVWLYQRFHWSSHAIATEKNRL